MLNVTRGVAVETHRM